MSNNLQAGSRWSAGPRPVGRGRVGSRPAAKALTATVGVLAAGLVGIVQTAAPAAAAAAAAGRFQLRAGRAVLLGDQAAQPGQPGRRLLAADAAAGRAAAVLLRPDHRRRRLGADRPRPGGLDLDLQRPGQRRRRCATPRPAPARSRRPPCRPPPCRRCSAVAGWTPSTDGIRVRRAKDIAGSHLPGDADQDLQPAQLELGDRRRHPVLQHPGRRHHLRRPATPSPGPTAATSSSCG